ncbi:hypothetical protein HDU67_007700 [Dinochytrium kinnereticum]|nr:hypothetical protein HDU67_007700 [Dinochytrium kinnereticum]
MPGPTGIHKQARVRVPLFVSIMSVVFTMTALIGVVVGYLTLTRSQESITDITSQMRLTILNRVQESVTGILDDALMVLRMKKSSSLENTGILFRPDSTGRQSYLASYPKWGQIYYQDISTNHELLGAQIRGETEDYSLDLDTNATLIRSDWVPDDRFPALKTSGIVRGKPFWSPPIYTPVIQTFLIPLVFPVWRGRGIGNVGEGGYHAAHFAMLSIKSLDNFLRSVQVSTNGVVSIIEGKTGLMLASSLPGVAQNGTANSRFGATTNPNSLIAASARFVASRYGTSDTIESIPASSSATFATSFKHEGDDVLVNGYWIRDDTMGLNWLVLLTIPSNDFLEVIRGTFRNAVGFVVGFCVASLAISGLLAYLIATPLSKLARSMVMASQFDFGELRDGYLERRSCVTEIGRLEGVFHELMLKFATAIKANKTLITARGENVNGLSTHSSPGTQASALGSRGGGMVKSGDTP